MVALDKAGSNDASHTSVLLSGGTATIALGVPARGNALGPPLVAQLRAHVAACVADTSVHTLVFRGEGASFCTGFDWSQTDAASDAELMSRFIEIELLLQSIASAPVRTVAAVHGRTWGAGADLMVACDLRIAAASTTFRFPGAAFGIVLGTRRLAARIGSESARRLVMSGEQIDAMQGLQLGLISSVADDHDAALAALMPPRVDRTTMAAIARASANDMDDHDLAALVRSAARPGLAQRLRDYRAAIVRN